MSIILKGCPRCGGDIELPRSKDEDPNCIQCGFESNTNSVARITNIKLGVVPVVYDDTDDSSGEY